MRKLVAWKRNSAGVCILQEAKQGGKRSGSFQCVESPEKDGRRYATHDRQRACFPRSVCASGGRGNITQKRDRAHYRSRSVAKSVGASAFSGGAFLRAGAESRDRAKSA